MVRINPLADVLKTLSNAEKRGKRQVLVRPVSKTVIRFLQVMQKHGEQYFSSWRFRSRLCKHRKARFIQRSCIPLNT
jgi:ribosomal protein S8